jgi:hypothetical protein
LIPCGVEGNSEITSFGELELSLMDPLLLIGSTPRDSFASFDSSLEKDRIEEGDVDAVDGMLPGVRGVVID